MKILIDKKKCYLSGECYYNHPELFSADDEGFPVVNIDKLGDPEAKKHAIEAAEVCPAVAITIEDQGTPGL